MIKYNLLLLMLFFNFCSHSTENILGVWKVECNFYKAIYKIEYKNKKLIGKVLYYNDDTTILKETGTRKDIFLSNLKYKNNLYVDAICGATTTKNVTLKIKHKDTLEVTNYIKKHEIIEIWTRKKPIKNIKNE